MLNNPDGGEEDHVEVQTSEAITIENNDAPVEEVTAGATISKTTTDSSRRKKRRARGNSSRRGENLNIKVHRGANRDDLLRETMSISAYIFGDVSTDGGTISEIIDDCMRLGARMNFAKTNVAVDAMAFGKLT